MRALAVLVALLLLTALAAGGFALVRAEVRRSRRLGQAAARWGPRTDVEAGETVVSVRRALPSGEPVDAPLVVARLAADDPDFDQRYADAMALARMRAASFNAELDAP